MHREFELPAIIHLLEGEKSAWSRTAEVLEHMTHQAVSEDVRLRLIEHIRECRGRSEAIRRTVARMSDTALSAE